MEEKKNNLHFTLIPPMFFTVSQSIQKSGSEGEVFLLFFFCCFGFFLNPLRGGTSTVQTFMFSRLAVNNV